MISPILFGLFSSRRFDAHLLDVFDGRVAGGFFKPADKIAPSYSRLCTAWPTSSTSKAGAWAISASCAFTCLLPLAHHPGDRWTYGYSTDVLALLVEQASGMLIDQFLQTRLFGPLGMTDTGFKLPPEKADRVAAIYGADLKLRRAPEESPNVLGTVFPRGNSGLVSTLSDYSRFVKCSPMAANGTASGI